LEFDFGEIALSESEIDRFGRQMILSNWGLKFQLQLSRTCVGIEGRFPIGIRYLEALGVQISDQSDQMDRGFVMEVDMSLGVISLEEEIDGKTAFYSAARGGELELFSVLILIRLFKRYPELSRYTVLVK
jgi:hypothetical protein